MGDLERNVPEILTHEMFINRLGSQYRVHFVGDRPIPLELIEVSERKISRRQENFAVYFRGPVDYALPQGTYRLDDESNDTLYLFLVPIEKDENGIRYEAIFNYLIKSE